MPKYYMVTINNVKFRGPYNTEAAAAKVAETWQGRSASYDGKKRNGLLKHKDFGDHVEVKRDLAAERDFDERYAVLKRGGRQAILVETPN
mgnify:CR=1 FL=1